MNTGPFYKSGRGWVINPGELYDRMESAGHEIETFYAACYCKYNCGTYFNLDEVCLAKDAIPFLRPCNKELVDKS